MIPENQNNFLRKLSPILVTPKSLNKFHNNHEKKDLHHERTDKELWFSNANTLPKSESGMYGREKPSLNFTQYKWPLRQPW